LEKSSYGFTQAIMDYTGLVAEEVAEEVSEEAPRYKFFEVQADRTKPVPIGDVYDLSTLNLQNWMGSYGRIGTISLGGSDVHFERDVDGSGSSDLVVRNSTGEVLAKLDYISWIKRHDLLNFSDSQDTEQILDPVDLTFEFDLGDLGPVKILTRSLRLELRDGDWTLQEFEFWVLLPAE